MLLCDVSFNILDGSQMLADVSANAGETILRNELITGPDSNIVGYMAMIVNAIPNKPDKSK